MYTPKRYRNWFGQLLRHSPFCERDLRRPTELETHDETGDFLIKVKKEGMLHQYIYGAHPFGLVGWDGYNYPYAFSIHDFEPITGRVYTNHLQCIKHLKRRVCGLFFLPSIVRLSSRSNTGTIQSF